MSSIQGYEVAFHRYNFLHLTGVKLNRGGTASAIHFIRSIFIRDVTAQPSYKVFAVISKHYTDDKYTQVDKLSNSKVSVKKKQIFTEIKGKC